MDKPNPQMHDHDGRPEPGPGFIRAAFASDTVDAESRTVEILFSTGASVRRWRWADDFRVEEYDQTLEISESAIDAKYLNSGRAPFLDSHNAQSLDAVLGVIEAGSVTIEEGVAARARVRFDDHELAERRFRSVKNGILQNVSVGFNINEQTRTRKANTKTNTVEELTATRWQPLEVSQVPIGADSGASVEAARAFLATREKFVEPLTESKSMEIENKSIELSKEERAEIVAIATQTENERQSGIRVAARMLNLDADAENVRALLDNSGVSLDEARAELIAARAKADDKAEVNATRSDITIGVEESEKRGEAIASALMHRAFPNAKEYAIESGDVAGEYVHRSLIEIARDCLDRNGRDTRHMSKGQVAEAALSMKTRVAPGMISTSDFPLLLAAVTNKALRMGYESAPRSFVPWARAVTASDFKSIHRIQLSGGLSLAKVEEGGEFTSDKTFEAEESYKLATFGRIVGITRQTLINDDLDGFARVGQIYGSAAADLESDTVYNVLTNNAAMADGTTLFHADHGNLATDTGAPSVARIGEGRKMMRLQTDLDDDRILNLMPSYVIAPAALETTLDQQMALIAPTAAGDAVPAWVRSLQVIVEPRLDDASATEWYMAANSSRIDTVEYCYLEGEAGVQISTRQGFEVDGIQIKARLDFAAAAIDHRGMWKNNG